MRTEMDVDMRSWEMLSSEEKSLENFKKTLFAFKGYRDHSLRRINSKFARVDRLKPEHQKLLKGYCEHLDQVRISVENNQDFLNTLTEEAHTVLGFDPDLLAIPTRFSSPGPDDLDCVVSTLKQFVREWSEDGLQERNQSYKILLDKAELLFPDNRDQVKVLVPGAGLGRLAFEFAVRGFMSEGNENSYFMTIASNFIINQCKQVKEYEIHPFVNNHRDNVANQDQVRSIRIPDVNPGVAVEKLSFRMSVGDFQTAYDECPNTFDIVTTCYFIDTARNIIEYIETIYLVLKPGGYWLNIGPLHYHFAENVRYHSIEPSLEEIRNISESIGFKFIECHTDIPSPYCSNSKSMLHFEYKCVSFVCQKASE